jgi:hypothetical protein
MENISISEESIYFNNVEILNSGEIKYSLKQPFSLMHITSEKTSYYKIKVFIEELGKNIILFFNQRFTVRDLFTILKKIEFGDSKRIFRLLINESDVHEDSQISSYVKLNLLQTHNDVRLYFLLLDQIIIIINTILQYLI